MKHLFFPISAATREGCDTLVKAISEDLQQQRQMLIEDSEPVIDDFDEDEENAQKSKAMKENKEIWGKAKKNRSQNRILSCYQWRERSGPRGY